MSTASDAIDAAIREVTTARFLVSKIKTKQVKGVDAIGALKSTALAWFNTHRPIVSNGIHGIDLSTPDQLYTTILDSTARHATRQTYLDDLRDVKKVLVTLRAAVLVATAVTQNGVLDDLAPD